MHLPEPRGPLTSALCTDLTGGTLAAATVELAERTAAAATDPLLDEDLQLALAICYELHLEAARLARAECEVMTAETPERPRYVAGALGPTNTTASISPDVNDPGHRNVSYTDLLEGYVTRSRPSRLHAVLAYMETHADQPLTPGELARVGCMSVRALHAPNPQGRIEHRGNRCTKTDQR